MRKVLGELKLTDFGIARITDSGRTRTGLVLGTPSFMSPEQLQGRAVTGRSDLFSLGVTLYQMLTGQLPFRADSMPALISVGASLVLLIGLFMAVPFGAVRHLPDVRAAQGLPADRVNIAFEAATSTVTATAGRDSPSISCRGSGTGSWSM